MRTIHLTDEDHSAWLEALRDSRDETIVVYRGGYRILLGMGRVLSSSGHSELDVTPVVVDAKPRKPREYVRGCYGAAELWSNARYESWKSAADRADR